MKAWLTQAQRGFFESILHDLPGLAPPWRWKNRVLLRNIYQLLISEGILTRYDSSHVDTLRMLADRCLIPPFESPKAMAAAELALSQALPELGIRQIRYALRYAVNLMRRHGQSEADWTDGILWLHIWRRVAQMPLLEAPIWAGFVNWMRQKGFSPESIAGNLRETQRLCVWMTQQGWGKVDEIDDRVLQQYLLSRGMNTNGARQAVLSKVKPLLYYYQEDMSGGYAIPTHTVKVDATFGASVAATGMDTVRLWRAIKADTLPNETALMLYLVLGHGLTAKALPLLRHHGEGKLVYRHQRASRLGPFERIVSLSPLGLYLMAKYAENMSLASGGFVFFSIYAGKNGQPVSVEYCRRLLLKGVISVLGHSLTIGQLERGGLHLLARKVRLTTFMDRTDTVPLTKRTRLLYGLHGRKQ